MTEIADRLLEVASTCGTVAAEGTDPEHLAAVLSYAVRPRRAPDQLRRALCNPVDRPRLWPPEGDPSDQPAGRPAAVLAALAGAQLTGSDLTVALRVARRWRDLGCTVALVGDPGYPVRLAAGWPDLDVPVWLVRQGRADDDAPSVALVGARRASGYGRAVAAWLAETASNAGLRVVSGGAVGIDAAAHQAALCGSGGTVVVLGCGHAVEYPRAHAGRDRLFARIRAAGGEVVGELLPDQPPRPGAVRARNRLVAALADVVVVVEGGERSGALLTADAAAALGRPVLAVPGDIRAPGSAAPHRLLRDGASPCVGLEDILDALPGAAVAMLGVGVRGGASTDEAGAGASVGGRGSEVLAPEGRSRSPSSSASSGSSASPASQVLPPAVRQVLDEAWPRPVPLDVLAQRCGLAVPVLLAACTQAQVAGILTREVDGVRLRRVPAAR